MKRINRMKRAAPVNSRGAPVTVTVHFGTHTVGCDSILCLCSVMCSVLLSVAVSFHFTEGIWPLVPPNRWILVQLTNFYTYTDITNSFPQPPYKLIEITYENNLPSFGVTIELNFLTDSTIAATEGLTQKRA
jgi:hypothetical protein